MLKISAVVCTYKRTDYLGHALRSLCDQTLNRDEYEILVVDNAVEAEAERIVEEFQDGSINLRYVPEPAVGLSRARNTGLAEARGLYVAYIDDDARADARWLETLVNAFEQTSPAPAAVGGRVWLDWEGEKPGWVPDEMLPLYTCVDLGEEGHGLRNDEFLVGANLAFEKKGLQAIAGFDPNLGRQGVVLLSGEEAHVLQKLQSLGCTVRYEPAAVVWHSVHPSRKRPGWLMKRLFWDGASQPLLNTSLSRRAILRGAWIDLRQCLGWSASTVVATVSGRRNNAWKSLLELSQRAGRVRTQLRMLAAHSD